MPRRRLWTITALVCLALVLSPALAGRPDVLGSPSPQAALAAMAAGAAVLMAGLVLLRRSPRPRTDVVLALARRGRPVPDIARRTRLAQDAVRDLGGAMPVVVSTGRWGRIFRRAARPAARTADDFTAVLEQSSFDASA